MSWTEELATVLQRPGACVDDPDVLAAYARDQAPLPPAGTARALVHARSVDDVVRTLKFAHARRLPVVTRGAGTGLTGGANALDGCIMLSLAKMDRVISIDETARLAVVEPGVINGHLAEAAAAKGLYYAPDPASRDMSTIGGNIATNAGGSCCMKYGVTGDHVAALALVLADGRVLRTGARTKKNVTGYDLTRLVVGSEGTLGVVVEATLRLLPKQAPPATTVAFFDSLDDASRAVLEMDATLDLTMLEIMDQTTVRAVEELTHMDLDVNAAAFVLAQSDAHDAPRVAAAAGAICQRHSARTVLTTDDPAEGKQLLLARRMALPALEKKGMTLLDDVAVPKPALVEMVARITAIGEQYGVLIGTFGHAGDGNLHPTLVIDGEDPKARERVDAAFSAILRAALDLGGTLAGEHGVGVLKSNYLDWMLGPAEREVMRGIKAAFDPLGILNPGRGI